MTVPSCREHRPGSPLCRTVTNWSTNSTDSRLTLRFSFTLTTNSLSAPTFSYRSQSKLGRGRPTDGRHTHGRSTVFSRWRQYACPSNTPFVGPTRLTIPTACQSVQPFLHGRCRILSIRDAAPPHPPKSILSLRDLNSHLMYDSLDPLHHSR